MEPILEEAAKMVEESKESTQKTLEAMVILCAALGASKESLTNLVNAAFALGVMEGVLRRKT